MLAVTSITFFFLSDVKCGLYEINKNNRANATHGPYPVQKMFRDRTEAMLDRRGPVPGPGLVLTLDVFCIWLACVMFSPVAMFMLYMIVCSWNITVSLLCRNVSMSKWHF